MQKYGPEEFSEIDKSGFSQILNKIFYQLSWEQIKIVLRFLGNNDPAQYDLDFLSRLYNKFVINNESQGTSLLSEDEFL